MSAKKIYILTGPVRSGKTTRLLQWSGEKKNVFGILTPVIEGKRVFMDAHTREQFQMEAESGEQNILSIGKFVFSKKNFGKAITILMKAFHEKEGWLVVDEIGPLELREEGFHEAVMEILKTEMNLQILFVIRDIILDEAIKFYKFNSQEILLIDKDNDIFSNKKPR